MSQQKILSGSRAQMIVNGKVIGLFTQVSWGVNYDTQASYILGRYSPAEITYLGQEAISINASGFRIIDNGPYVLAVPKLQDLMTHDDISIAIFDRQTNKQIMTVVGVRPSGFSSDVAARAIAGLSVSFTGLRIEDESGSQGESAGASDLSSGQ